MMQLFKHLSGLAISLCLFSLPLLGQERDSIGVQARSNMLSPQDTIELNKENEQLFVKLEAENNERIKRIMKKAWVPNPNTAMLWAILPGGGQVYNRKYWKLPIVWGAFMTCYYSISWNQRMYNEYHSAYRDIKSTDPSKNTAWLAFAPKGTKAKDYAKFTYLAKNLERGNKFYRRYRDLSIVAGILVYGLSVLDAYVDAELATFDISPDLSLQVTPCLMNNPQEPQKIQMGLGCNIRF